MIYNFGNRLSTTASVGTGACYLVLPFRIQSAHSHLSLLPGTWSGIILYFGQFNYKPKRFIDGFFIRKSFCNIRLQKYKVCPGTVGLCVFSACTLFEKGFQIIFRA